MARKSKSRSKPGAQGRVAGGTRPSWSGHLKVSLVSCPVALYNAQPTARKISFHLVNPKTKNRIHMVPYDPDTGPVERSELAHGYELEDGRYVLLDEGDLDKVRLESTRTIDIRKFVDAGSIDPIFYDQPYFMVPGGDEADDVFAVIRDAMRKKKKVGLARLVLANREHTIAIAPRGRGMSATMLRDPREMADEKKLFSKIADVRPDHDAIGIATKIIARNSGDFDPSEFEDRYETALRELIEAKAKGARLVAVEEPTDTNVIDLMEALKASLRGGGRKSEGAKGEPGEVVPFRGAAKRRKAPAKKKRRARS
jgi:DNA end-binding protein Ku